MISELLWDHFGINLRLLWDRFGVTLESLFGDHFGDTLGSLWDHLHRIYTEPGLRIVTFFGIRRISRIRRKAVLWITPLARFPDHGFGLDPIYLLRPPSLRLLWWWADHHEHKRCSLNIMLRVFSTPAPESSQFILKLQLSDPRRAPGELLLLFPSIQKLQLKKRFDSAELDFTKYNLLAPTWA